MDSQILFNFIGTSIRYVKLRVVHTPRMSGTFSPPPWISDPDMHHDTCVTHVPWYMPGSLTSGSLWSRWREKRSRRMCNAQFYVSGKMSMVLYSYMYLIIRHPISPMYNYIYILRSYTPYRFTAHTSGFVDRQVPSMRETSAHGKARLILRPATLRIVCAGSETCLSCWEPDCLFARRDVFSTNRRSASFIAKIAFSFKKADCYHGDTMFIEEFVA